MSDAPKLGIRLDDPETRAVWETAKRAAREVAAWPAWKHNELPGRGVDALFDRSESVLSAHPMRWSGPAAPISEPVSDDGWNTEPTHPGLSLLAQFSDEELLAELARRAAKK